MSSILQIFNQLDLELGIPNQTGWKKLKYVMGFNANANNSAGGRSSGFDSTPGSANSGPGVDSAQVDGDDIELAITKLGSVVDDFGPFLHHLIFNANEEDLGLEANQYQAILNESRQLDDKNRPVPISKAISSKALANLI